MTKTTTDTARPTLADDIRAGAMYYTRAADRRIACALEEIAEGDHETAARTLGDILTRTALYVRNEAAARVLGE